MGVTVRLANQTKEEVQSSFYYYNQQFSDPAVWQVQGTSGGVSRIYQYLSQFQIIEI